MKKRLISQEIWVQRNAGTNAFQNFNVALISLNNANVKVSNITLQPGQYVFPSVGVPSISQLQIGIFGVGDQPLFSLFSNTMTYPVTIDGNMIASAAAFAAYNLFKANDVINVDKQIATGTYTGNNFFSTLVPGFYIEDIASNGSKLFVNVMSSGIPFTSPQELYITGYKYLAIVPWIPISSDTLPYAIKGFVNFNLDLLN